VNKYLKELERKARAQGWRVEKRNHLKWFAPDGRTMIVSGGTESDHRALQNTLARMRRAGFRD
jgi:hypothetical protein